MNIIIEVLVSLLVGLLVGSLYMILIVYIYKFQGRKGIK
jgi:hypothetical protein